jgi:hypothetical protein
MKKDFIFSKIEAPQDGSPYVFVAFTDPNEPKSAGKLEVATHKVLLHPQKI